MSNFVWYVLAALFEIAGCYALWMWLRLGRSAWWIFPAAISLVVFGLLLTRIDVGFAGRAYAAYGGVYIVASLTWLAVVERTAPLWTDFVGVALCLAGTAVILFGPRIAGV